MSWLLVIALIISLLLIPLGLPGLWFMIVTVIAGWLLHFNGFGVVALTLAIAIIAELIEFAIVGKLTAQYGGSRKAFWGAIIGGAAGVVMGAPVPVIGSIVMGFVGAFLGAFVITFAETRHVGSANKVGLGAVVGRALTAVAKTAAGLAILVIAATAILR